MQNVKNNAGFAIPLNRKKMTAPKVIRRILNYLLMSVIALILIFPYFYMVSRSFMTGAQVMLLPTQIIPSPFSGEGWRKLFEGSQYVSYTFQTLKVVLFNVIAIPLSASFVAFGFSKLQYAGKNILFAIMMGTMMLPGVVLQTPLYVLFHQLGWLDSLLPLTIPNLFGGGAIYIFLIRQYMVGLPKEIDEAAKIDGANLFFRFVVITLPLCVPILVYIVVSVFGANWSDFYTPLIYISDSDKATLAVAVFRDVTSGQFITPDKANIRMAAGVFMSIFPAILFVIFQKQLIEGVSTSALKG